ncbi:transcriptional regulator ATRX homolog isoform X1 [Drosophila simulans]|uniref:Uncharacterized protein, isoform A n=1 Tax=Drosophila simulans TaxID=7240 RepID=A0A0J9RHD2_DROSI|nr:transcriptional regulator ATRX homolog isoform X1 [Drosophila simulans]KMY95297.1 uncharacterized protein Dsimw501_GD25264, isoform A [Drosophila simulans]
MAMLAEPRRRKRYNLCPRGKALYEDENRFGTKMLEKMGWTKGSGLGANLSGEKDFVRIRFKNDAEGLGFEQRDDQWTVHEDGFNGLLKSLNGDDSGGNDKEPESEEEARPMGFGFKAIEPEEPSKKKLKENTSGMSLEERSKQSRARVHYKKFTRGKDLALYSEKDLANIFGKKATEDVEKYPEPVLAVQPEEPNPNFAGVQTIVTGLSTTDYFKQKMEAMKNRLKKGSQVEDNNEAQTNGHAEKLEQTSADNDEVPSKKKKKKKDKERAEEAPTAEEELEQVASKPKKKKKSKRSSIDEEKLVNSDERTDEQPTAVEEIEQDAPKLKKKKKSKRSSLDEIENNFVKEKLVDSDERTDEQPSAVKEIEQDAPKIKKKKKSKRSSLDEAEKSDHNCVESVEVTVESENTSSKKKKSKKKEESAEVSIQTEDSEQKKKRKSDKNNEIAEDSIEEPAAKKKKKSKKSDEVIVIDDDDSHRNNESHVSNENGSKKRSKSKDSEETTQTQEAITIDLTDDAPPKKKKKSKEEKKSRDNDEKDSEETPTASEATEKKSKKKSKLKSSAEPSAKLEITSFALAVEAAVDNRKDTGAEDRNDVSADKNNSGDKSVQSADEDLPKDLLSLEEIQEKLKSFNHFNISKFCADQFQLFDMSAFHMSSLGEIVGYGISENVELNVVDCPYDETRIRNLWKNKAVEYFKSEQHIKYPVRVQRTSIRAVKKRVAFEGI